VRAFVTGATGLVGSHLVEQLVERGDQVRALIRKTSDTEFLRDLGVELVCGDLLDASSLFEASRDAEIVFHCAGLIPIRGTFRALYTTNVRGTENLLKACTANNARRFVYVSSVAVYGYRPLLGADESQPLVANGWYSASKIEAERIARQYQQDHALETVILRPCAIYGARDKLLLPSLLNTSWWRPLPLLDGGRYIIDFVDAVKLAQALILAAIRKEANGQAYNITDGASITFRDFVAAVSEISGKKLRVINLPSRPAYYGISLLALLARGLGLRNLQVLNVESVRAIIHHQHFDISKARRELGYEPHSDFRDGLRVALNWFSENKARLNMHF